MLYNKGMDNKITKSTLAEVAAFRLPSFHEIPDVGLYLEQTTAYINSFLTVFPELEITNSMLSNYVKKGLVARSVKKLYYREQIAYFIYISVAKNVLSMENIRRLFTMQRETYESQVAYDYFRLEFENVLQHVFGLKDTLDQVGVSKTQEKQMLRYTIIAVAHKLYVDKFFADVAVNDDITT